MDKNQGDLFISNVHADYTVSTQPDGSLLVVDIGHTYTRSVTNDIEYVVADLVMRYGDLAKMKMFYQDSEGSIDEIIVKNNKFSKFRPGPSRNKQVEELGIF